MTNGKEPNIDISRLLLIILEYGGMEHYIVYMFKQTRLLIVSIDKVKV